MASEKALQNMIHAIMDKRKQLGFPDWGLIPVEEVIDRINMAEDDHETNSESSSGSTDHSPNQS